MVIKMELVARFIQNGELSKEEYVELLENRREEDVETLRQEAVRLQHKYYGNKVFVRGLIEFTNYCKNNCYYCGIRGENKKIERYRLSKEEIMECCKEGYALGFRTFVLQGGEDPYFTEDRILDLVQTIKAEYPECALTLSIGELGFASYQRFKEAGADRYLLRHETANATHYGQLHPKNMSLQNRKECLYHLKHLGFQIGAGFMVGSPGQTKEYLAEDLLFLKELQPQMVGIGPFIPHHDTPLKDCKSGSLSETLLLLSMVRIILPKALIPATTALGTIDADGREKGILAGANVIMPNLSPLRFRKKYALYDNKICTGEECGENKSLLEKRMEEIGYKVVSHRGDALL
ncbi:MAG: [FeFe] hydrogenase H-cluster radical SAM maturase HydE [Acetivibrio sp.]